MDSAQETDGSPYADGSPKLPLETIRPVVTGTAAAPAEKPGSPGPADEER